MSQSTKPQAIGAYDLLRQEILHGTLMPGERLRVADLNNRYDLGLTPIREALVRLASEGLIVSENHRGARVREATVGELHDLIRTRQEIERLCLTEAIARGDAAWEGEIMRAYHVLSRAPMPSDGGDYEAAALWEGHHRAFHFALVSACGSHWLLQFWNTLADHSERYRKLRLLRRSDPDAGVRDINAEHARIMEAVIARDTATAVALMNTHISATGAAVRKLIEAGTPEDTLLR